MDLTLDSLACRRSGRLIFSGVCFALGAGEAIAVTGRNGAGKSTLLAAIAGRVRPDSGSIAATGLSDRSLPESLHWIGHREALKASLTAIENLDFARDLLGDPGLDPEAALERVGLSAAGALPVGYLSAGQRRRVALARLLVARRPLWLLDEPLAALDESAQAMLAGLMREHLREGGLIVAATHAPLGLQGAQEFRLTSPRLRGEAEQREARPGEGASPDELYTGTPPHPDASRLDLSQRAGRGE